MLVTNLIKHLFKAQASKTTTIETDDSESYTKQWQEERKKLEEEVGSASSARKYQLNDFEFKTMLGKGSFGKVILAQKKGTNEFYALKALRKDIVVEDNDVESTMTERRVLAISFRCPFLTHLYCTFQSDVGVIFKLFVIT